MPYALEFYLLLFVAEVVVFLVARSLAPLGLGVNSVFAFAALTWLSSSAGGF